MGFPFFRGSDGEGDEENSSSGQAKNYIGQDSEGDPCLSLSVSAVGLSGFGAQYDGCQEVLRESSRSV
jgi:hypothetical protein